MRRKERRPARSYLEFLIRMRSDARKDLRAAHVAMRKAERRGGTGCADDALIYRTYELGEKVYTLEIVIAGFKAYQKMGRRNGV